MRQVPLVWPDNETITVGETSTLPYAVRIVAPGRINVFHTLRGGVFVARLPRSAPSERDLAVLQGYMRGANYSTGSSTAPGFLGIGAQSQRRRPWKR